MSLVRQGGVWWYAGHDCYLIAGGAVMAQAQSAMPRVLSTMTV